MLYMGLNGPTQEEFGNSSGKTNVDCGTSAHDVSGGKDIKHVAQRLFL